MQAIRGIKRKSAEGWRGSAMIFPLLFLLFLLPSLHAYLHPFEAPHLQTTCKVYGYHFEAGPSSPSNASLPLSLMDCGEPPRVAFSPLPSSSFFLPLSRSPPL